MPLNIHDYLIALDGMDWSELLSPWSKVLPREFDAWMVNRFGDVILVTADGRVSYFDSVVGEVRPIAASREDFASRAGENADDWFMIPLVNSCVAAGLVLQAGECYGYVFSPALGGAYAVSNVRPIPIAEHYALHADIHEQIKDLPDGAEVELRVRPDL